MKIFLTTVIMFLTMGVFAQSIEDIRYEQDGNKINVFYKITNATNKQSFKIILNAKINDQEKLELKFVSGDVGDTIVGGKEEYKAVWDVLNEVDELNSAEFFVSLTENEIPVVSKSFIPINKRNWFAAYHFNQHTPFGLKTGYLNSWGFYISGALGMGSYYERDFSTNLFVERSATLFLGTAGPTKRVFSNEMFALHVFLGGGYTTSWYQHYRELFEENLNDFKFGYTDNNGYCFVMEGGIIAYLRNGYGINIGIMNLRHTLDETINNEIINQSSIRLSFGLNYSF